MGIYINGIGTISAQILETRSQEIKLIKYDTNRLNCLEPNYIDLVPAMQLRRMSKVVRMGVAVAKQALKDADIEQPDIITLGTAYGCLADTEIFLSKLLTQDERMLTPTSFIQSTHNTVSGQIALHTNCYGHNFTYVHRGHSFEASLQECIMWLKEKQELPASKDFNVLFGGIDELTNDSFDIMSRFGTFKTNQELDTEGTIAGEGAHLFVASNIKTKKTYAQILDMLLCYTGDIQTELIGFLKQNKLTCDDIDTCLIGVNGDSRYDETIIQNVSLLKQSQWLGFKSFCGEYPTSNAFGLTLTCMLLQNQAIPETLYLKQSPCRNPEIKNVLLYNHYKNKFHSFILLKRV